VPARTVEVDRDRCIGSGVCLTYAPGAFDHDDDAKAVVIDPSADGTAAALDACPTAALRWTDGHPDPRP
jgi:ferredoxin